MNAKQIEAFRLALLDRQKELIALREVSASARAPVVLDQQSVGRVSRVDAMQQQAMAQAQDRQRALQAVRIEQALARIEKEDFGTCADCDEEIPLKRLQLDPASALCVRCAARR